MDLANGLEDFRGPVALHQIAEGRGGERVEDLLAVLEHGEHDDLERGHPRLPADKIPYWDFDAPNIPSAPREASAATVMSSALIELSGMTQGEQSAAFLTRARQQLTSLASPVYFAKPGENGGFILLHSVGNLPKNSEIDVPLNYADYYFLEALIHYQKRSGTP